MLRKKLRFCAVASLLAMSGCQSSSTLPAPADLVPVVVRQPPLPEAWFMQRREPNLTQRMLNELSPSLMMETKL